MRLGIMQPYFLPYIGYFQLIAAVDTFVVYDNIKYTKKGWINRNRILQNGDARTVSLPLRKDSDSLDVVERTLAPTFDREDLLKVLANAYRKAPRFAEVLPLVERIVRHPEDNLFSYIHHSLAELCGHLGLETPLLVSSTVPIDHSLRGVDKVLALCEELGADTYLNPIGGTSLYSRETFADRGISLHFLEPKPIDYPQFGAEFVPWLSILDVLMFNEPAVIDDFLKVQYTLL